MFMRLVLLEVSNILSVNLIKLCWLVLFKFSGCSIYRLRFSCNPSAKCLDYRMCWKFAFWVQSATSKIGATHFEQRLGLDVLKDHHQPASSRSLRQIEPLPKCPGGAGWGYVNVFSSIFTILNMTDWCE